MSRERRKNFRVEWTSPAIIELPDGQGTLRCVVANLSNGGAKITDVTAATLPEEFGLRLSAANRRVLRCQMVWRRDHEIGVRFMNHPSSIDPTAPARREASVD
jgi:hypothetical protein